MYHVDKTARKSWNSISLAHMADQLGLLPTLDSGKTVIQPREHHHEQGKTEASQSIRSYTPDGFCNPLQIVFRNMEICLAASLCAKEAVTKLDIHRAGDVVLIWAEPE
ncbi:hypothetical protein N7445_006073 [Penicillium cf. griseofulvum]|nr:hypothetical protein N7445_006073 [Penicillium cf. griseofulvum]